MYFSCHNRLARKAGSIQGAVRCKRAALLCINNAFKLNALINTDIEAEDVTCLEEFNSFRQELVNELLASNEARTQLGSNIDQLSNLPSYTLSSTDGQNEEFGTHELLISEADTVMAMAEEQLALGFRFEAMLNFHTSCVFYRVMETMIPSKASSIQHSRLMHAANVRIFTLSDLFSFIYFTSDVHYMLNMKTTQKTRLTCSLYQNFVRENFTGGSCSDVYEVHGSSKLVRSILDIVLFTRLDIDLTPALPPTGQRQLRQRVSCDPPSHRRRARSEGDERRPHHQLLPAQAAHGDFNPEELGSSEHHQDPRRLLRQTVRLHRHGPLQRRRTFRTAELGKEPRVCLPRRSCGEADERYAQRCELSTRTWYQPLIMLMSNELTHCCCP